MRRLHYLDYREHRALVHRYRTAPLGRGHLLLFGESYLRRLATLDGLQKWLRVTYLGPDGAVRIVDRQLQVVGPDRPGLYVVAARYYTPHLPPSPAAPGWKVYAVVPADTPHPILFSEVLDADALAGDLIAGYHDYPSTGVPGS